MHKVSLEEEKEMLNKQLDEVNVRLDETRKERDMYKAKYEELQQRWKIYCNAASFMTLGSRWNLWGLEKPNIADLMKSYRSTFH